MYATGLARDVVRPTLSPHEQRFGPLCLGSLAILSRQHWVFFSLRIAGDIFLLLENLSRRTT
jgi:hypothetical protein